MILMEVNQRVFRLIDIYYWYDIIPHRKEVEMKVSISTGLFYKKNYKEILDIICSSGWRNIELFINQAFVNIPHEEIKIQLEKREIKVQSIHAPIRWFFDDIPDEVQMVNECIALGEVIGTRHIITHDIFERDADGKVYYSDDNHFRAMSRFKNSEYIIMTENMPFNVSTGSTIYDIDTVYDFVKENNYNLTFDTAHAASCGTDIIKAYDKLKPFIRNIHLSDYKSGSEHKMLGTGTLPIKEFLQYLKKDKYSHLLTVEYDFDNPSRNDIKNNKEAVYALKNTMTFIEETLK